VYTIEKSGRSWRPRDWKEERVERGIGNAIIGLRRGWHDEWIGECGRGI
jgi:hypothetical protein